MIKTLLTESHDQFTKGELKIVRELLDNYPTAALGTVASLAARAHVSAPTVVRFAMKLGFEGFADFQKAVMAELSDTMKSPLSMIDQRKSAIAGESPFTRYLESVGEAMGQSLQGSMNMDLTRAVDMLSNRRITIKCLGGRFSHHLAAILQVHLHQLHGKATLLSNERAQLFDGLVDVGARDVLVVFDYRRYQADVVEFCNQAKELKARIILFTDPYRSPIAAFADIVITTGVEVASPYDTMTPALAVTEALVAGLTGKLADTSRERLAQLETFRDRNRITLSDGTGH